jgi:phosphatidylserine/phosphatidylglycerophosphate/cardiolipin synthase-like enzyme
MTAYFYFSGFNEIASELKNKKIRIIIGKSIDPEYISDLSNDVKHKIEENLDEYSVRKLSTKNNSQKKKLYIQGFVGMFNKSPLTSQFDGINNQNIFKLFFEKLNDGSLEIRLNSKFDHSKIYIITNKPEYSFFREQNGMVIMGSSNFTYNGLVGQGETNEQFIDNEKYNEYMTKFQDCWEDSNAVDIQIKDGNNDFTNELKNKLWIFAKPKPYNIYIRILY